MAVIRIGGGTSDVTIIRLDKGIFTVKGKSSDLHLGGEDLTNEIVTEVNRDIVAQGDDPIKSGRNLARLFREC